VAQLVDRRPTERRRQLERRGSHWIARLLLRWFGIGRRRCRRHGWDRRARLVLL
jgi:hypothetical protein